MPCFKPLNVWRCPYPRADGKRAQSFSPVQGWEWSRLPCGQCIGCRLEYSRQWAVRISHEAQMHDANSFITLTFDDKHLPDDLSLNKKTMSDFWKRLRKNTGAKLRYYYCGEYGAQLGRPHYHACVFGYDFPDKYLFHKTPRGDRLYRSPILEKSWTFGYSSVGRLTFESAAYVSRYVTKKVTGSPALHHYNDIDYETGEILASRLPEYAEMSTRPGIASGWLEKFGSDVFPHDHVIMNGKKMKPPRYYDKQLELIDPSMFAKIKQERIDGIEHLTDDELDARLEVLRARMKLTSKRPLE